MVMVPRTGTLTHVGFGTGTVTSAAAIQLRLETMSTFNPSGTLYAANATGSQAVPSTNTYYRVPINGGLGVPVTQGDRVAVVLSCPSGSPNLQVATVYGHGNYGPVTGWGSSYDGAEWVGSITSSPTVQFEYSDAPAVPEMGSLPTLGEHGHSEFQNHD